MCLRSPRPVNRHPSFQNRLDVAFYLTTQRCAAAPLPDDRFWTKCITHSPLRRFQTQVLLAINRETSATDQCQPPDVLNACESSAVLINHETTVSLSDAWPNPGTGKLQFNAPAQFWTKAWLSPDNNEACRWWHLRPVKTASQRDQSSFVIVIPLSGEPFPVRAIIYRNVRLNRRLPTVKRRQSSCSPPRFVVVNAHCEYKTFFCRQGDPVPNSPPAVSLQNAFGRAFFSCAKPGCQ